MSINMECETVEELWDDERGLIRAASSIWIRQLLAGEEPRSMFF